MATFVGLTPVEETKEVSFKNKNKNNKKVEEVVEEVITEPTEEIVKD